MPKKRHNAREYPFVISYDAADQVYIARAVDLAGCHSDGATPEKAVRRIYEAIEGWLETARKKRIPIPAPSRLQAQPKKFLLRIEPHNVTKLETMASYNKKSLNKLINEAIEGL